jgi:hypothetical protein
MDHACESVAGFLDWLTDALCGFLQEITHMTAEISKNNKARYFNPEVLVFIFEGLDINQMIIPNVA